MIPRELALRAAEMLEREAARMLLVYGPPEKAIGIVVKQRDELVAIALELRRHAGA